MCTLNVCTLCFILLLSPSSFYLLYILFFFFNDTATTEIYTLSLHDALPIWICLPIGLNPAPISRRSAKSSRNKPRSRSEEHTSELQSHSDLVCRLLLEKKKKKKTY